MSKPFALTAGVGRLAGSILSLGFRYPLQIPPVHRGRARPGHPRSGRDSLVWFPWMPGTSPGMTNDYGLQFVRLPRVLACLVVGLALVGAGTRAAGAQDATLPGAPQIFFTPNLWLAGVNAAIKTPLQRAPEVNADVGPFQVLGHLDAVPFLGQVEIHDGPFSLLGGAVHLPVSTSIATRNVFFDGGTAGLIANAGTATLLYRVLEQPTQYADLGVGFRPWAFTANLTLNPGLLPGASATRSTNW